MTHTGRHRLAAVMKTVHTAIFFVEPTSIGWPVIALLLGRRDRTVALAAGAVSAEAAVFCLNRCGWKLATSAMIVSAARSVFDTRPDLHQVVHLPLGGG